MKETEGDGSHDSSAMEDSGLQEQLRTTEAGRGDEGNGSLDWLDNGGGLQTSEGKHQKGFDEWTNVGGRYWQKNGSRFNIRQLGNKWLTILLR